MHTEQWIFTNWKLPVQLVPNQQREHYTTPETPLMPLSTALYTLLIPLILKRWLLFWFLRAWTSSTGFGALYKWTHTLCTLFIWLVWCNIMILRFIYLIVCSWRLSILRVGLYDSLFVHSVWIRVWVISRAVGTFKYLFLLIKCVCVSLRSCAQECNCWGIT